MARSVALSGLLVRGGVAVAAIRGVQARGYIVRRRHREADGPRRGEGERALAVDAAGIRGRDDERVVIDGEWEHTEAARPALGYQLERLAADLIEVSDWKSEMARDERCQRAVVEEPARGDSVPDAPRGRELERMNRVLVECSGENREHPAVACRGGVRGEQAVRHAARCWCGRSGIVPRSCAAKHSRSGYKTLQN